MCYWVGTKKIRLLLEKKLEGKADDIFKQMFKESIKRQFNIEFQERYINIARSNSELTIIKNNNGNAEFANYNWSLRWNWEKDGKINEGKPLPNIRDNKVSWRHKELIGKNNCVLPITGYFEFHHHNGETYPFYIYPKDGSVLFAAGLYNDFVDQITGEIKQTFGLLTTNPNKRVAQIHNNPDSEGPRMLVLLPPDRIDEFLDPVKGKNVISFCKPYPADKLSDHPIIRFLRKENAHLINDDMILEPVIYPELIGKVVAA